MDLTVLHACAFEDNYIWLATTDDTGTGIDGRDCVIIDPGDADATLAALEKHSLRPRTIFCTHKHGDHVGGVRELAQQFSVPVYGPSNESIRDLTHPVNGGETIAIDGIGKFSVLATPGHTNGHISYVGGNALFCGDTLFSSGCGRLFDGTAAQLFESLSRLAQLPGETRVYCAHEYTLSNLAFAQTVEPGNPDIAPYIKECQVNRKQQRPTLPSSISRELKINPFLRTDIDEVKASTERQAGRPLDSAVEIFTELRKWKDRFTG